MSYWKTMMKIKIKYPKFLLLIITVVIACILFGNKDMVFVQNFLKSFGIFGGFFTGIFFVYSFTAIPASAVFLILAKQQNIFFLGITGGIGALVGDLLIFYFIRHSFSDEIELLAKEKFIVWINKKIPKFLRYYIMPILAGIMIASPLPDEIGIAMLASSRLSTRVFSALSLLLNTAGIFAVVWIGKSI